MNEDEEFRFECGWIILVSRTIHVEGIMSRLK